MKIFKKIFNKRNLQFVCRAVFLMAFVALVPVTFIFGKVEEEPHKEPKEPEWQMVRWKQPEENDSCYEEINGSDYYLVFKEGPELTYTVERIDCTEEETESDAAEETEPEIIEGVIEEVIEEVEEIPEAKYEFSKDDAYLLAKIAMAEAEGLSTKGKAFVVLCVLNRVESDYFPNSIKDVIFEYSYGCYQFSPIGDGRWNAVEPDESCYEAVEMVANGWDESQGALYFETQTDRSTWHSRNLKYLFDNEGVTYYRTKG